MEARSAKFMRDIARMFNDTKYSDATVVIHKKELPVHKSVICTQSEYFEKAFQGVFVEGSSGVLTFNNDSGAAHWRVFEYLYTGDYSDDLSHDFEDDPALLKEPRVYVLANMFFLEDLKALATAKLQQKLQNLWTDDSFPDCIREIYATTLDSDHAMRSAVIEVAKAHVKELGRKSVFKDLIHEGGDFAVHYFESVVFSAPPVVSSTLRQPGSGLFGGPPGASHFGRY
ncbi:BTB POZ domain-containing protein [Pyrenophora tritici-repentis]|nr:BTB POZ domain-containing protein [Pyrenophora tritici-repentis]